MLNYIHLRVHARGVPVPACEWGCGVCVCVRARVRTSAHSAPCALVRARSYLVACSQLASIISAPCSLSPPPPCSSSAQLRY
jgi:hypothetical protein